MNNQPAMLSTPNYQPLLPDEQRLSTVVKGECALLMETSPMTALGMGLMLEQKCGITGGVLHASKLSEIHALLQLHHPRVLVMELCGEGESVLDGLRLISRCNESWPLTPVVVCTELNDPRGIQLLVSSGVSGLVLKQEPIIALVQCIQSVLTGGRAYSPKVQQMIAKTDIVQKHLTARELDVLDHLFTGKNVTRTASMMHLDIRTVSTYKRNAMFKLGFHSDSELFSHGGWMAKSNNSLA
ncbi:response regulator transcription factor [Enterobacillus tribolii]|uniref:Two-component system capsular synthesis response regulator RcsB n=1 Tax=Enterobacillus tribolii TaxID=1487935 RepID=A0A370QQM8_9GAMM|nr:response regulator transcription factor [Enterobacillus tribolii]RDK91081.1 two-component system capsular synthesis response regulator RcsB [Enterobacillus tribolii]